MCKESLTKQSYHRVCFVGFSRWTWACQQTDVPSWFELSVYAEWSFWAIYILSLIYSYWAFMFHPHSVLLFSRSHPASLLPLFFFFSPLSSSCAFPPFCYHSNRRAALHWKGHTPRGPPLSSRSEGRMRRRKELREYVRTRSPLHRHRSHSHSWPLTPSASPSAPIGGAARPHESAVPLTFDLQNCTWHESVLHYCVTTGRRRFCWVIASILLVKFSTFFSLTVRLINI